MVVRLLVDMLSTSRPRPSMAPHIAAALQAAPSFAQTRSLSRLSTAPSLPPGEHADEEYEEPALQTLTQKQERIVERLRQAVMVARNAAPGIFLEEIAFSAVMQVVEVHADLSKKELISMVKEGLGLKSPADGLRLHCGDLVTLREVGHVAKVSAEKRRRLENAAPGAEVDEQEQEEAGSGEADRDEMPPPPSCPGSYGERDYGETRRVHPSDGYDEHNSAGDCAGERGYIEILKDKPKSLR